MSVVGRFLLYNLLPALAAGILTWLVIEAGLTMLRVRNGRLRLPLLYLPLIKSMLVMLGMGLVLPWPREVFASLRASAIPPGDLLPLLLLWVGVSYAGYALLSRRTRRQMLAGARPAALEAPRLRRAYKDALAAMEHTACPMVERGWICCSLEGPLPRPVILVSDTLPSPLAMISDHDPAILFPTPLVSRLSDRELVAAVAHELAHFTLRRPACFSSTTLERWMGISPLARLLASHLRQEEEKACDDMVVAALGEPTVYAEMLLKSYRYARERGDGWPRRLAALPRLLGLRPALTERVERLLQPQLPGERARVQRVAAAGVWCLSLLLFLS